MPKNLPAYFRVHRIRIDSLLIGPTEYLMDVW